MQPDFNHTEAKEKGYRILAGEFDDNDPHSVLLMLRIYRFIEHTGGRVAIVTQSTGNLAIYRPIAEMETRRQTERRLKRAALRKTQS